MFGIGMTELLVVLVIVVILFGPGKLPDFGSGIGKAIREFKKGVKEIDNPEQVDSHNESTDKKL